MKLTERLRSHSNRLIKAGQRPILEVSKGFKVVEKKNPLAVHGIFMSRETAERHIMEAVPEYIRLGYFSDKTLTARSFKIVKA